MDRFEPRFCSILHYSSRCARTRIDTDSNWERQTIITHSKGHFPIFACTSMGNSTSLLPSKLMAFVKMDQSIALQVVFHGSAWCSATNPDTKFSQVVVPPVPLVPEAAVVALQRFKAFEKRPRLPLVKNQEGP